jgi:hypothetical protein
VISENARANAYPQLQGAIPEIRPLLQPARPAADRLGCAVVAVGIGSPSRLPNGVFGLRNDESDPSGRLSLDVTLTLLR